MAGSRYDLDAIRHAARGRWPEILSRLGGLPTECLDGGHHPCPKCGGHDRFRLIDKEAGAVLCNQCFRSQNGDGFAALMWATGRAFSIAIRDVAELLGIPPLTNGAAGGDGKNTDPAKDLDWLPWNETLVAMWCLSRPPIVPDSVRRIGGRLARYRDQFTVIAIPTWGADFDQPTANPVGWTIYNVTGGKLPKWSKDSATGKVKTEWVKSKVTFGSQPGVICAVGNGSN